MIKLTIDGQECEVEQGSMIIEAADNAHIKIPRFCYHKKLPIAANCRMCLVEVEKAPKPLPACATPVTNGMVVHTCSARAIEAQRSVMEFLLINHPLDCPVCDQGGECELQDVAMGYGNSVSRYTQDKRVVEDKNIGPLIATDMTRCIHCTRCVRFGTEIAQLRELGVTGRGEHTEIGTFIEKTVASEISANIIDLCPVGALTSKPFRFTARSWELTETSGISPHDCLGTNLYYHSKAGKILRVVPKENEAINEVWCADRDRFAYMGYYTDRLENPMIRENGNWKETTWEAAFEYAAQLLEQHSASGRLSTLMAPTATTEEAYLLQKISRGLGSNHIDHRLWMQDTSDDHASELAPTTTLKLSDIETLSSVLLIGSNTRIEQPLFALRLRKMVKSGGTLSVINPIEYDFLVPIQDNWVVPNNQMVLRLAQITKAAIQLTGKNIPSLEDILSTVTPDAKSIELAQKLVDMPAAIVVGEIAQHHAQSAHLRLFARVLATITNSAYVPLTQGPNSAGITLAGGVPHRGVAGAPVAQPGMAAHDLTKNPSDAHILFGFEPHKDVLHSHEYMTNLKKSNCVIACSAYLSPQLKEVAHVLLPIALPSETSGTYVNTSGQWQSFSGAVAPAGQARPGWKVLRVLGNFLNLPDFGYTSSTEIADIVKNQVAKSPMKQGAWIPTSLSVLGAHKEVILGAYQGDPMVRRSAGLQESLMQKDEQC